MILLSLRGRALPEGFLLDRRRPTILFETLYNTTQEGDGGNGESDFFQYERVVF
jgi:hypothetical protein